MVYGVMYSEREELEADIFARVFLDEYLNPTPPVSVFFSYAAADEVFATRLYDDLEGKGIRCWKFDRDARTGQKNWGEIDKAIRGYDKVLLIASEHSLQRPGVIREIERAIRLEDERIKAKNAGEFNGDVNVLFPVRVDNYVLDEWSHERKVDIIAKVIANAQGWAENANTYRKVLNRLVRDLTQDDPTYSADRRE